MMPAARAPPKPVPEEGAGAARLEEPVPGAVEAVGRAGAVEVGVADVLAGVDEGRLAAAGPGLMADEGAAGDEGVVLASPGFAFEAFVLVAAMPGLVAALGEATGGFPPPTTGGDPAGVAGTDPGAPLATAGLADDDASAPPVAAPALTSSFVDGVDAADALGAGFASLGLDGAEAASLDTTGDVAPARSADAGTVGCAVVVAGVLVPPPDVATVCASVFVVLSPSVTVFFSALRSIVCPRVCFGFDRRGRLVIAFAPFLLAPRVESPVSRAALNRGVFVLHSCGPCKHRLVPTIKLG